MENQQDMSQYWAENEPKRKNNNTNDAFKKPPPKKLCRARNRDKRIRKPFGLHNSHYLFATHIAYQQHQMSGKRCVKFILALWLHFQVQIDDERKKVGFCSWGVTFTSFVTNIMGKSQSLQNAGLKKMSFWQVVKRFFEPINGKKWIIIVWLWVSMISFFQIFEVAIVKNVIDSLELWNKSLFLIWLWSWVFIALFLWAIWFWFRPKTEEILYNTIQETYDHTMPLFFSLDQQSIEKVWTWKIQEIVVRWIDVWWRTIYWTIYDWIWVIITISSSLLLIFSQSIKIWFIGLWIMSIFIFWILFRNTKEKIKRHLAKNEQVILSQWIVRQIMSRFEIVQSNKQKFEIDRIGNIRKSIIEKEVILEKHKYLTYQSLKFWSTIFWFFIWWFIGFLVLWNQSSIAEYVFVTWLFWLITRSIWSISEWLRSLTRETVHIEKLWSFLDNTTSSQPNLWNLYVFKKWNFEIKNIIFSYESWDKNIFQNFSLQIQGWTKTAFVGESWGGKTTLIKLLAGCIRPDSGEIEIDGQKLSEIKLTDYYKHIGYLTQDPSVFDGTIYENLVYALDTEPPKEDLEKVVKLAKCEFIREFEKWLETEIGERWVRLSWWQKQRLAIAKIMLKNPNIILLDEPTSALDSFNEEQISIALHNLFKGKTVIVVAHRLQTVKQADRILFFEQGKILEEGTHDELVKLWWKYKKMLDLQSGF